MDVIIDDVITTGAKARSEGPHVQINEEQSKLETGVTKASAFLISIANEISKKGFQTAAIKLLLPHSNGYVVRSDFLEQRLYGCPSVHCVKSFVAPRQYLRNPQFSSSGLQIFLVILASAAWGIVLGEARPKLASLALKDFEETSQLLPEELSPRSTGLKSYEVLLAELEEHLIRRFSISWLIPEPIPERTVAIVDYRPLFVLERWIRGGHALGCRVLIIGPHGSLFSEPQYAGLIDKFLPIDMTVDQGLPQRILGALQHAGHRIDGITATVDAYLEAVAKVSSELGLYNLPIESVIMAQDKYVTRVRFGNFTPLALLVDDVDDLRKQLATLTLPVAYPLIVKASRGWCSEGIFKVKTQDELFIAVSKVKTFQPGIKMIVESYVDGPEVDVNFLLWDGEIQFCEVVDDFPCSADSPNSGFLNTNFQETAMVSPSILVPSEQEMLKTEIHNFLLESGFRNGMFHVEARIQNSVMEYNNVDDVLDLRLKADPPTPDHAPRVFILEVNVRCPGFMLFDTVMYNYGVDYAAAQMLTALGDKMRFKILSRPFPSGAQASVATLLLPAPRGGLISDGASPFCEELRDRRPDLLEKNDSGAEVLRIQTLKFPGETIPDPQTGVLSFLASFNLAARHWARTEMLRRGQAIREEVKFDLK